MLSPIAKEVAIPENLALADGKSTHTVASGVQKCGGWGIEDFPIMSTQAAAEINVFKPEREKPLIKTSHALPSPASYCQTGARRLINLLWLGVVQIEAAIIAVQRIGGPETVEQQYLGRHGQHRRESAHAKAPINFITTMR